MKKIISMLLALLCVFALCACGGEDSPKASDNGGTKTEVKPDYGELYYASGDVKFGIFDLADDIIAKLGEPTGGTFESDSCAYQGKDYFYYYDGFELMVNDIGGTKRITGITVADDTVQTPQGLKIGMKLEDALALMNADYTQAGDIYKFVSGSAMLRLRVGDDGTLAAIEYSVAANDTN